MYGSGSRAGRWGAVVVVLATVLATVGCAPSPPQAAAGVDTVAREPLTLDFGDFTSHAELTYPVHDTSPRPTVVLIGGSGPEDLNATVCTPPAGAPLSMIFSQIAEYLSARGYAVLRYDKHYVTGPCRADPRFYTTATLSTFARDADTALRRAEADPHVDPHRVSVYGWSEGSTIAAVLAVAHPELAGLIVQGPVATSWHDVFVHQLRDVVLPYAHELAPDGRVTADTLRRALSGDGGLVAKNELLGYLADPAGSRTHQLSVNPDLDTNHDGVIEVDTEFAPRIDSLVDYALSPSGFLAPWGPGQAPPAVGQQAPRLVLPVLILQGEHDANVSPPGAASLNAALTRSPSHTLRTYSVLGHSLGPATSVIDDNFRPMAAAPLAGLTTWLAALPPHV